MIYWISLIFAVFQLGVYVYVMLAKETLRARVISAFLAAGCAVMVYHIFTRGGAV